MLTKDDGHAGKGGDCVNGETYSHHLQLLPEGVQNELILSLMSSGSELGLRGSQKVFAVFGKGRVSCFDFDSSRMGSKMAWDEVKIWYGRGNTYCIH